jgi:endo-1,4-beta-D-glucanase Y
MSDEITSKVGKVVANALDTREKMQIATEEAMDASFAMGVQIGIDEERQRIIEWIEENRSGVEIEDGVFMYRDHFRSEDLIRFISGE